MNPDRWRRLDAIFLDVLQLPAEERPEFLAQACGSDDALRLDALSLVGAAEQSGEFMIQPALDRLATTMAADGWSLRPGERVGAYTIRELVGAGGAGEVWRATDERLGRDVAIKVLLPHLSDDPDRIRRFTDEARTAGALNHSNILSVYDVGEHGGAPFIVSEYVEGESLRERLKNGPLPIESAVDVALQIARGLAAAHARGITHRDLKPENVFLRSDGGVKLLDFGLAMLQGPSAPQPPHSMADTATMVIAGTAAYMAPEQARGEQIDARADLFALGATLYEMLTGERAFKAASTVDTLRAILTMDAPALGTDGTVPSPLAAIVARLLEKEPNARFQTAADAAQSIERLAGALAPVVGSRTFTSRAFALAVTLTAALAIALTFWWRAAAPVDSRAMAGAGGRRAIAVMAFANATGGQDTAWLTHGVPNMLITGLAQTGLDVVSAEHLQDALKQTGHQDLVSIDKSQMADVARRAGAGAVVTGTISAGPDIRIDAQVDDLATGGVLAAASVRGADVFALVDQLAGRIRTGVGLENDAGVRRIRDLSTMSLAAYRLYSEAMEEVRHLRWVEAQQRLEQAVAVDPTFAEAHLQLAIAIHSTGQTAKHREHLRKAAEHAGRLSAQQRLVLDLVLARDAKDVKRMASLVDTLLARFPNQVVAYPASSQLYDPTTGAYPNIEKLLANTKRGVTVVPRSTLTHNAYAYALLAAGRFDDALAELDAYAGIAPREANPLNGFGDAYLLRGMPDKAVEVFARAVAIDPTFNSRNGLAYALGVLGRYDDALAAEADFPYVRAILLSRIGRYRQAAEIVAAGLQNAEANENTGRAGSLYLTSALLALERKDYRRALQDAARARERLVGAAPGIRRVGTVIADTLSGLAEIATGQMREARLRLEAQSRVYRPNVAVETWWHQVLAGEIALADGDIARASEAFSSGAPPWPIFRFNQAVLVVTNTLVLRDGLARAAQARGDFAGAIQIYRRLLEPGPEQKWVSVFEPRYVLQIARLLGRAGDTRGARAEYLRFLDLWKGADTDLPELAEARRALARNRE